MAGSSIAAGLNALTSMQDVEQLRAFEGLLKRLTPTDLTKEEYLALLAIFERFPDDDAHGGFWSVIHILEESRKHERLLVESAQRIPTEFNLRMISRLLNGGIRKVDDVDLLALLKHVVDSPGTSATAKTWASDFINQAPTNAVDA